MSTTLIPATLAKMHLGQYFERATKNGEVIVIHNATNKRRAALIDYDVYLDLIEIHAEQGNVKFQKELLASKKQFSAGEYDEGMEVLTGILRNKIKKETKK